ncbi:MAG: hypothetical protein ACOC0R_04920 [Mariniphaga sp.]
MNKSSASNKIAGLVNSWKQTLHELPEEVLNSKKNHQNRTIKQIIGHLVDSASNNHQRIVRLQYNPQLDFPDYRQDNDRWIALQKYQDKNWERLVQLWYFFNLHIAWIISQADDNRATSFWTDYDGTQVSLEQMIDGYYDHLLLHLNEVQELINS